MTTLLLQRGRKSLFTRCCRHGLGADAGCRTMRRNFILVRDHPCDFLVIRFIQNRIGIELAFALGCFGSQDVAFKRVTALDFARTCLLEALRRSAVSL